MAKGKYKCRNWYGTAALRTGMFKGTSSSHRRIDSAYGQSRRAMIYFEKGQTSSSLPEESKSAQVVQYYTGWSVGSSFLEGIRQRM